MLFWKKKINKSISELKNIIKCFSEYFFSLVNTISNNYIYQEYLLCK
uniref:Uncharacterized protein n=1 Tax=Manihot esculenta TaxID=3983 RepID=A0A2C9UNA2_MANES